MSFSFGQATSGGGFSFGTPKTTASTSTAPGFSLQTSTPAAAGFTFGAMPQQQSQAPAGMSQIAGLLAQTTTSTSTSQSGFSFGTPSQSSTVGGGFTFGAPKLGLGLTPASQPATTAVTLGGLVTSTTSSSGTGFTFGALPTQTAASTQQSTGFSFPGAKVQAPAATSAQSTPSFSLGGQSTGLTLGAVAPASAASSTGINFGIKLGGAGVAPVSTAAASQAAPVSSLFATPIPSAASTGFSLGSSTSAAAASAASSAVTASTGLTLKPLGAATTTATTTAAAPTVPTTSFSLGLKPAVSAAPATSTAVSTAAVTASAAPVMSYAQLESLINKWSSELEDQERHFLQQATQVNAWDRMLVENGEKITSLHKDMEKVKLDQRRLDQELDFILSQQKELEDLLAPLEESVKEQSGTIYMQNADEERERTYKLSENVDAQLKRMSQDLKEIIEHLNTSNGLADASDPLQQICKILNAHMDSLQWVEQNSVLLQRRVEEVSKLCESRSKEQDKSFRLSFQ
ncbi:nucleoporin 62 like isoform X2 [Neoarius graeffei]|uniref:nucleoporin 62 like isoform X2 n=1 Tax=Neoarius graeffei TaxID=443677 RepID=UPI00298CADF7|nr:nucleoporin 62 like isoform X2 [Neoarius graeffei]